MINGVYVAIGKRDRAWKLDKKLYPYGIAVDYRPTHAAGEELVLLGVLTPTERTTLTDIVLGIVHEVDHGL